MITVLKPQATDEQRKQLVSWLESQGVTVHVSKGAYQTVLGLVGDVSAIDMDLLKLLDIVEDVKRVTEPYKEANRKFQPEDTVIKVADASVGGGRCERESAQMPCAKRNEWLLD